MRLTYGAVSMAVVFCLPFVSEAGSLIKRTKDPALAPDGKTIAFAWQSDIWTVSSDGGEAKRLTVHPSDDGSPVWSKDGSKIVFSSNRYGNLDLFVMNSDGSGLKRLTYDSSNEYPNVITPDGTLYGYTTQWGRIDLFRVSLNGGDLVRVTGHPLEMEYYADIRADGRQLLFNTAGSPGHWRKPGYAGANTAEVWTATPGVPLSNMKQVTDNEWMDLFPVYMDANTALTVSNPDGHQNIHRLSLANGRLNKITNFNSGTIRALTYSPANNLAAYQKDSTIYVTNTESGATKELEITAPDDMRRNPVEEFEMTTGAQAMDVSPNGKLMVINVRGDLFLLPAGGGTTRRLTTNVRADLNPNWIDDETILYEASEEDGHRHLMTVTIDGEVKEFYRHTADSLVPTVSPDKKWVAFHRGGTEICVMPTSGGTPVVVTTGDFADAHLGASSYTWSPDSEWLGVEIQGQRSVGLYFVKRDGSQKTLVTRVGKSSSAPIFSPDGKYIGYVGIEGLDYSETRTGGNPGYIVALVPPKVTFSEDDLDKMGEEPEKPGPVSVEVELDGINHRKRKLPYNSITGAWPAASGDEWYINADGQFMKLSASNGRATPVPGVTGTVSLAMDTKHGLFYIQGGRVFVHRNNQPRPVNFEAVARVNMQQEELALFEYIWWGLDRMFYVEDMHGKDWDAVKREYAAMVPYCTSRDDFYDLMDEMVERLDSSHQGATSSDPYRPEDNESTGWLGIEWDWQQLAQGNYVVGKVYDDTPASHPQMELMVGDRITMIDGVRPGASQPVSELLRGKNGKKVRLTVERRTRTMEIEFKPTSLNAVTGTVYDDWVAWSKAEVDRLSNGRLGYIHIQGMNNQSLDTFLREIATDLEGKDGVIVDVRYNGGGYTSHIILNIMRKEPWMIRTTRDLPGVLFSENMYRGNALELPAAAMTNEYSFSNAEIFSEGFQRMKLGPVIGERTGGAVIGTYSIGLWDGGQIRLPASGAYTVDMVNLENDGRKPTVPVDWDPVAWQNGRDVQLERAVEELMKRIR